jgi:hypothetical protein
MYGIFASFGVCSAWSLKINHLWKTRAEATGIEREDTILYAPELNPARILPMLLRPPILLIILHAVSYSGGWSSLVPRPQHRQADPEAQADFKKSSPRSLPKSPDSNPANA